MGYAAQNFQRTIRQTEESLPADSGYSTPAHNVYKEILEHLVRHFGRQNLATGERIEEILANFLLQEPNVEHWPNGRGQKAGHRNYGCDLGLDVRADVLTQVRPDVFRHTEKNVHDIRVELASGPDANFLSCRRE